MVVAIKKATLALEAEKVALAKEYFVEERKQTEAFEQAVAKFALLADSMAANHQQKQKWQSLCYLFWQCGML